jgi:hypothetical protein
MLKPINHRTLLSIILLSTLSGKAPAQDLPGIYYLEGVMETASGFKLNPDHTFEFFFSQGALDRTGKGTWKQESDTIILNSIGNPPEGFELVKSEHHKQKGITVTVKETNTMLLSFVHVNTGGDFEKLDGEGNHHSNYNSVDSIRFIFELSPERLYSFQPQHADDNYFEFVFKPDIFDCYINNMKLKIVEGGLRGGNPMLEGLSYTYYRQE